MLKIWFSIVMLFTQAAHDGWQCTDTKTNEPQVAPEGLIMVVLLTVIIAITITITVVKGRSQCSTPGCVCQVAGQHIILHVWQRARYDPRVIPESN